MALSAIERVRRDIAAGRRELADRRKNIERQLAGLERELATVDDELGRLDGVVGRGPGRPARGTRRQRRQSQPRPPRGSIRTAVLDCIRRAGAKGARPREIVTTTRLESRQVHPCLATLKRAKEVKAAKGVYRIA